MPELSIASFNVHWGLGPRRRGWRPFDLVDACRSLEAEVVTLQETWSPDHGPAQYDEVAGALGFEVVSVPMARAVLVPQPKLVGRAEPGNEAGVGSVCLAVLSRRPIRSTRVVALPQLPLDPWSRAVVLVELDLDGANLTLAATHFSHLERGALLQTRALRRALPPTDRPAVFAGDMNMWGWTVSAMIPAGWHRAVRGKTWPASRPSHQIDHLLVTQGVEVVGGEVLPDLGSDHLPIRARLRVP